MLAAGIRSILGPATDQHLRCDSRHEKPLLLIDLNQALLLSSSDVGFDAQSVLVVESGLTPPKMRALVQAGLAACVSADGSPDELHRAIRALRAREGYFCPLASAHLSAALSQSAFTPREQEVLELLCSGLCDKSIATRLCIAPGTVKVHVKSILAKTGTRSRTAAATKVLMDGAPAALPIQHARGGSQLDMRFVA